MLNFTCPKNGRMIQRGEKNYIPHDVVFKTKPQIALDLIDRSIANGILVDAWTADELYGRDTTFLDGLDERTLAYVVEIPADTRVWLSKPNVLKKPPKNTTGRLKKYPRLARRDAKQCEVRNLAKYSPSFTQQNSQKYKTRDGSRGAEVWEIMWHTCWRKTKTSDLASHQCTLIVARNVLTEEVKYFLSNRVPNQQGWTLRRILRAAFARWSVEGCFREAKEEIGFDHFECRGWRCIHRHLYTAILGQLFCAQTRKRLSPSDDVLSGELLTMEQVRRAMDVVVATRDLSRPDRQRNLAQEVKRQQYYARRNAVAAKSHQKTRRKRLKELGIDPDKIKSITVSRNMS
jgi:SRSO17 transposase